MTTTAKQRIVGATCASSACSGIFCISRMIPYGLAGDVSKVKLWFVPSIILLAASVACGIVYYFYLYSNRVKDKNTERLRAEVNILTRVGHKPVRPTLTYPEQNQPKEKEQK